MKLIEIASAIKTIRAERIHRFDQKERRGVGGDMSSSTSLLTPARNRQARFDLM